MKNLTTDESRFRSGFAILREMLFPVIILVVMISVSRRVEGTGNSLGHRICLVISIIAAFFCLYRLISIFFFADKIYNKAADYSVPRRLMNVVQGWKDKIKKKRSTQANSDSVTGSKTEVEQIYPSNLIEWGQYPDELKQALLMCWNDNNVGKALRLAAPVVFLMKSGRLHAQPNYKQMIKFFNEELSAGIDQSQLVNECDLIMRIINKPSDYTNKASKCKLMHYKKVEEILSKF